MLTGKAQVGIAVILMSLALSAQAEAKRYLISFKSAQTFQNVKQSMRAQAFSQNGAPQLSLFGSNAVVSETLDAIEMMVIESSNEKAVQSLRNHPAIALVEEEFFHPAPKPIGTFSDKSVGVSRKVKMETPWGIKAVKAPGAWATTKGQNIRVMVLDTGVQKDHPALASRFEKGKNFSGGAPEAYEDTIGHGTHVAGTILADGKSGGLVGVAPLAKLLMGKVCAANGCSNVGIASGINWAVEEKVDLISMSLGGAFISSGEMQALRRAEQSGVVVTAASGNGGTASVSYPAAFENVLAVGAVDINLVKADFSQWGRQLAVVGPGVDVVSSVPQGTGRGAVVKIDSGKGLNVAKSLPFVGSPLRSGSSNNLVFAGLGKPEDFAGINVQGKFALISRGEIAFKDKVAAAAAAGAVGVVIYNNAPGLLQGTLTDDGTEAAVPAVMIEQTVGEEAKASLAQGRQVVASLTVEATDYASFQGTSMATPHVAGVIALVRSANRSLTPVQVREILRATATPLGPNNENQYGSGIVNAEAAVARAMETMLVGFQIAN